MDTRKKQPIPVICVHYSLLPTQKPVKRQKIKKTINIFFLQSKHLGAKILFSYLKILIKINNDLILLYGNGRGMGADPMRDGRGPVFLKSGAKVRRKADSCKHYCEKVQ